MLKSQTLYYAELHQVSLKEDLVYNDYSLFAEEFIWKSQSAEEFIKSFQFSLVTTLSRFWVSQGKEGLCAKRIRSRISLINSLWPELWKINTEANASVFIFHNSSHSEFIYQKDYFNVYFTLNCLCDCWQCLCYRLYAPKTIIILRRIDYLPT